MKKALKQKVVIAGAGNVAWHMASHLVSLKKYDVSVYNHRENEDLNFFTEKLGCRVYVGFDEMVTDADIYIICVADKAIRETAKKINIKNPNALLLHVSGSMKLKELGDRVHGTG